MRNLIIFEQIKLPFCIEMCCFVNLEIKYKTPVSVCKTGIIEMYISCKSCSGRNNDHTLKIIIAVIGHIKCLEFFNRFLKSFNFVIASFFCLCYCCVCKDRFFHIKIRRIYFRNPSTVDGISEG